ncbi:MAG: hypothetical protein LBP31_01915 [Holosporales bacterium]|jgi:NADH:ubiquinone oxidoreductase subunit 3 (subunit A)|nr:hypothetical protein [Holosporales bacterium]
MLILVAITLLIAAGFCVAAIGISSAVDSIYKNENKDSKCYECGFVNFENIRFFDKKLLFVPSFIIMEIMITWVLFCVAMSICFDISVQYICFFLFFAVFVACLFHFQKKI